MEYEYIRTCSRPFEKIFSHFYGTLTFLFAGLEIGELRTFWSGHGWNAVSVSLSFLLPFPKKVELLFLLLQFNQVHEINPFSQKMEK